MEVSATLRYLRIAPRKVRLVVDLVRGMDVNRAEQHLLMAQKWAATPVLKLLRSAIANAENNNKLDRSNLYVKKITADGGPVLKRYRPAAFGSAHEIRKRTTHVTIVLGERVASAVPAKSEASAKTKAAPAKKAAPKAAKPKAAKKAPAKKRTKKATESTS